MENPVAAPSRQIGITAIKAPKERTVIGNSQADSTQPMALCLGKEPRQPEDLMCVIGSHTNDYILAYKPMQEYFLSFFLRVGI